MVSPDLISRVTDAVLEDVQEWRKRPLAPVWPIVYLDALVIRVREAVQTCIVHMIRNSTHFVSWKDRKVLQWISGRSTLPPIEKQQSLRCVSSTRHGVSSIP